MGELSPCKLLPALGELASRDRVLNAVLLDQIRPMVGKCAHTPGGADTRGG